MRARPPRAALKDPVMPAPTPNTKLRNWLVLIVLAGFAGFIYVAFIVKMAGHIH